MINLIRNQKKFYLRQSRFKSALFNGVTVIPLPDMYTWLKFYFSFTTENPALLSDSEGISRKTKTFNKIE